MPRSVKRRLERMEARAPKPAPRITLDRMYDGIEQLIRAGHPFPHSDAFRAAWADPQAGRARLAGGHDPPPDAYQPDLPAAARARVWASWDHPDLDRAASRVRCAFLAWGEANGLLPRPGGRRR